MVSFIRKHKLASVMFVLLALLIVLFIFASAISSTMAAAGSLKNVDAVPVDGAMGVGLPEFLTYQDIEYCVYLSNEKGIPASILLGQIILNQDKIGNTFDVFLMGKEYSNVQKAIRDYAQFLSAGQYAHLRLLNDKYQWCIALHTEGVVNDSDYPALLRNIIDSSNLGRFDGLTLEGLAQSMSEGSGIAYGEFMWPLPVKGILTSPFGGRLHPVYGYVNYHSGQDIGTNQGTSILAADGGVVEFSGWLNSNGGYTVIIDHQNSFKTMYCHIMEGGLLVTKGQKVSQGQQIARVGSTGASTGPHLHFSVIIDNTYVDPMYYLTQPY